jgi:hypothetical protein
MIKSEPIVPIVKTENFLTEGVKEHLSVYMYNSKSGR